MVGNVRDFPDDHVNWQRDPPRTMAAAMYDLRHQLDGIDREFRAIRAMLENMSDDRASRIEFVQWVKDAPIRHRPPGKKDES